MNVYLSKWHKREERAYQESLPWSRDRKPRKRKRMKLLLATFLVAVSVVVLMAVWWAI